MTRLLLPRRLVVWWLSMTRLLRLHPKLAKWECQIFLSGQKFQKRQPSATGL
jgi:hypothetical protein